MLTEVIPLGTGSAMPTRGRHFSSFALRRGGSLLLFDCGEGTQFGLLEAGLKNTRIEAVFITHFHGDHLYGLVGLLSTLGLLKRRESLTIVGPRGLQDLVNLMPGLAAERLTFSIHFVALDEDMGRMAVYETDAFTVEARPLAHSIFAAGYRFAEKARPGNLDVEAARVLGVTDYQQYRQLKSGQPVTTAGGRLVRPEEVVIPAPPGSSFAYVTDTRPCENGRLLAHGVDVLYHEATFTQGDRQRALETKHATAHEAATIARDAGAARLLIGHFSARYQTSAPLLEEARAVFENTEAAEELKPYLLRIPVGFEEKKGEGGGARGDPR